VATSRSSDRDVIIARRALFVAATLSVLSGSARAELPKKPECKRDAPASAAEEEEAKLLARDGLELAAKGLDDEALYRLERAFEMFPHPKLALLVARQQQKLSMPNQVIVWASAALDCGLEAAERREAEELVTRTKASSGEIELRVQTRDPGQEQYVNGAEIDPDGKTEIQRAELDQEVIDPLGKLYVTPGRHVLVVTDNFYRRVTLEFEIAAGDSRVLDVELEPAIRPQVCLQPLVCLQPCLQPPPPPERRPRSGFILDFGLLGLFDLDQDDYSNHGFGGVLGLGLSLPLGDDVVRAYVGVEGSPAKLRSGTLLPFGGRIEAAVPMGILTLGLGVTGGYASASADPSGDGTLRPVNSPFVEPYFQVDVWVSQRVALGFRDGVLFTKQASASDEAFRLGFLRAGIFFRYAFAGEDEEIQSARRSARMPPHGW
jgi:hypothetical protein